MLVTSLLVAQGSFFSLCKTSSNLLSPHIISSPFQGKVVLENQRCLPGSSTKRILLPFMTPAWQLLSMNDMPPINMMEHFTQQLQIMGTFVQALKRYKEAIRLLQAEQETMQDTMWRSAPDFAGAAVEGVPLAGPLLREGVKVTTRHLLDKYHTAQIRRGAGEDPVAELTRAFVAELNRYTETQVTLGTKQG